MVTTDSKLLNLQPIMDKFSMKLRASWKIPVAEFELEFMNAVGEVSQEPLTRYAVDTATRRPEYDALIVYWIEECVASVGPTECPKQFLAQRYRVPCWLGDKHTRAAYKAYLAEALQN